jgi:hypothetical protein
MKLGNTCSRCSSFNTFPIAKSKSTKTAHSEKLEKEVQPVSSPPSGLPLSYPLRSDFLAQVVIPRDLTLSEAKRLGAFLLTIAVDYQPD